MISASKIIMWIKQPVLSLTVLHMLKGSPTEASGGKNTVCDVINPLVIGIIFFLAAMVILLLILLFRLWSARHDMRVTLKKRESAPVSQNCELNVRPPTVNGAYDSSSTSSESAEGSLVDISSGSQRYVTLQYHHKDSDYINISEGNVDLTNKKSCDIDYENVTEPQVKVTEKEQKNCDDGNVSDSSDTSVDSAVHYSKIVFPNV